MSDDRPKHIQIAADLRAQIMAGTLAPGEAIPSTRALQQRYGASGTAIANAVGILKAEGWVLGQQGKAVTVRDAQMVVVSESAYFEPSPGGYSYKLLGVEEGEPPKDVARALSLESGEGAVLRQRLTLRAGVPVEVCWSYYPLSIAAGTPLINRTKIRGGAPAVLAQAGFPERRLVDRVSSRMPTPEEVEHLDIPDGVSVLRQFRVIYSDSGRPVEVSIIVKPGHLYELEYERTIEQ
ncbi:GntR family transcriptional regulator [Nonomuraea rhodomycinica]|uniref:GntR family transcriptional regulator n=1 Tax=Nonomuraea rhodomycinica TaxID=1712872 RepID=A0A7Y6IWA2_9ACTN|nr:GntR family transcriptional regulator [Nonomuraea rhodomycinica]NUW45505.1 GntR family transcriptional regulator [Nonomuraea rhodomycinica]